MTSGRAVVGGVVGSILVLIVLAPLLARSGSLAAFPVYAGFSWICHQDPARSWHLGAWPLAVCVRCLGIYAGALGGALAGMRFSRLWLLLALALLSLQWTVETAGWTHPLPWARLATGLLAGLFSVPALLTEHRPLAHRTSWVRSHPPS